MRMMRVTTRVIWTSWVRTLRICSMTEKNISEKLSKNQSKKQPKQTRHTSPKKKKLTEEEELEYQRTMLGIKIKEELREQGIDPNSEEGIRIYSQRMGSSDIAHDTIWIKLVKKEENVDGTVKQVIQIVKDPKVVSQYRKKLKKPKLGRAQKKLTAPHTLKEEAEQANVKRQKRKLQEKLRRLKRIQETQKENAKRLIKAYQEGIDPSAPNQEGILRCAACGLEGHMKTNRKCPLFVTKEEAVTSQPLSTPIEKKLVIRVKTSDIKKGGVKREGDGKDTKKKTSTVKKKKPNPTKKKVDFDLSSDD
eukprot:TRINITY_DN2036_c0_g1_i1.p1 TRINITY_DN2036_c0_g1~~TRINITY_DN2036_c0_g1_i1.p1  ORF type:complete len:306 (+),score=125.83 TRINITY_DN2036_c0_g1_i1:396-1313(+)